MTTYASELVKYARSLANIPSAQYVSHNDEVQSLSHSYKDVYTKIAFAKAAYDYMTIGPVSLDMTTAVQIGNGEWEIALPDNVYSLRYVDYRYNGYWNPMLTFNINQRNKLGGQSMYRWLGEKLWVIGILPSEIRIRYFPPPSLISTPDVSYQYALQYQIYELPGVSQPQYFSLPDPVNEGDNDYCLYTYNGTTITLESYSLNTVQVLYAGTSISQALYWLGYIYFLEGGDIWRVTTNLVSTGVPVNLTASTNAITNFSITADNKLAYSTSTDTYFNTLSGSSEALIYPYATKDLCLYTTGNYAYIKSSSDAVYINNTIVGTAVVQNLASDGIYLYYLNQNGAIHRMTLDNTAGYAVLGDYLLYTGMDYMGPWWDNRLPIVDLQYNVKAVSSLEDSELKYPLNEAWEIMAYQSAIDYKRKAEGDINALQQRLNEIWARFEIALQRDSGQAEHSVPETEFYGTWGGY